MSELTQAINVLAALGALLGAVLAKVGLWLLFGNGEKWRWSELRSTAQGAVLGLLEGQIAFHVLPPQADPWQLFYMGLGVGGKWALVTSIAQRKATAVAPKQVRK